MNPIDVNNQGYDMLNECYSGLSERGEGCLMTDVFNEAFKVNNMYPEKGIHMALCTIKEEYFNYFKG